MDQTRANLIVSIDPVDLQEIIDIQSSILNLCTGDMWPILENMTVRMLWGEFLQIWYKYSVGLKDELILWMLITTSPVRHTANIEKQPFNTHRHIHQLPYSSFLWDFGPWQETGTKKHRWLHFLPPSRNQARLSRIHRRPTSAYGARDCAVFDVYFDFLIHVQSTNMEEAGFMTHTTASKPVCGLNPDLEPLCAVEFSLLE